MELDDVGNFLSRWSRRKLGKEEPKAEVGPNPKPAEAVVPPAVVPPPQPAIAPSPTSPVSEPGPECMEASYAPLQPVETLTPESDFRPFMNAGVDPGVKQAALKQLFKDPHFNVMDGLDTYIDDYSKPDPIPEAMMKTLYQARQHLFSDEEKAAANLEDQLAAAEAAAESEGSNAMSSDDGALAEVPEAYRSLAETAGADPASTPEQDPKA